ncbi:IPT/TIG domain-containing protein [Hymenobacter sp. M29]|uniref:IPT/TIG domain-containing protein n=1 Tax=Hymenobacter mellowenesis TaxID=3063995 RepID=A0ABT9AKL0_9BACT|nr:IPT/TIG domain-containing protein [Hymenobacter sp. M29]MDO7849815.1 IPT/TIG domain-containing protein [Hymenobacter sp. M29]
MPNISPACLGALARPWYVLLASLWLALLPLLALAGAPSVLTLQATVAAGPGVDATVFVDQVVVLNANTGAVVASAVTNSSFETPGAGWAFATNSGIIANGSNQSNPAAPDGTNAGYLQSNGNGVGSFGQTLASLPAGSYQLRLQLAQRPTNTTAQGVRLLVDGTPVGTFTPAFGAGYTTYTSTAFVLGAVLSLEALGSASQGTATDVTAFVDQVELLHVSTGTSASVPNASFENTGSLGTGSYGYNPNGADWTFESNSGLATNGSAFNNPAAPNGTHAAFLQTISSGSGYVSQELPTLLAGNYRVRLYGAQRGTAPADQVVLVRLNGLEVGRFQPTTAGFVQYTLPSASTTVALPNSPPGNTITASPFVGVPNTVLTLTGTNLTGTTSIAFAGAGGARVVRSGFVVNAAGTSITGVVVPGGALSGRVLVTGPGGRIGTFLFVRAKTQDAGDSHTVAVRPDGTLRAWGDNVQGQLGNGTRNDSNVPVQAGTATNWVSAAAGTIYTAAVKADGTLWAWGDNGSGQLGDGTNTQHNNPTRVGTATNWVSVTAGQSHTVALRADGTLWAWGNNSNGQLGDGTTTQRTSPVQVGTGTNWVSAAAGQSHTVALRADGTLWTWGDNTAGQLGNGSSSATVNTLVPVQVGQATSWVSVTAGYFHTLAVRADGTLWAWGNNNNGQLGINSTTNSPNPVQVGTGANWISVDGGQSHTVALQTDGTLWAWGSNSSGQLGNSSSTSSSMPVQVGTATSWTSATAGRSHSAGEQTCNALLTWGNNSYGQLGNGSNSNSTVPVLIFNPESPTLLTFSPTSAAAGTTVAVTGRGLIGITALNVNGFDAFASVTNLTDTGFSFVVPAGGAPTTPNTTVTGNCGASSTTAFTITTGLTAVSPFVGVPGTVLTLTGVNLAGTTSIVFAGSAGVKVVTSGFVVNAAGTSITGVVVPAGAQSGLVQVARGTFTSTGGAALFSRAKTLATGYAHTVSVRADGTLWAWGNNAFGQLGNGSTTSSSVPVQVGTATNWVSVAAGDFHTVAVKTDGTLWAWGENFQGQLGNGSAADSSVPVQVGTATNWANVAAGASHTLGVTSAGTLYTWGSNSNEQLGAYITVGSNSRVPVAIFPPSNALQVTTWVSIEAGDLHSVGVMANGTLWAWGDNGYDQLGIPVYSGSPLLRTGLATQVGTATNWVSVAAGSNYTLALRADGSLWSWGYSYDGQLGFTPDIRQLTNTPTQAGTDLNWTSVAAGESHTVALRADGTLWACGSNAQGQSVGTPIGVFAQVGTATSWTSAAAGGYHSAGEQSSCRAVWAWGYNYYGQVGDGSTNQRNAPVQVFNGVSLTSFSPASAPVGSTVAVTGTGLLGLTALTVNGANALPSVTNLTDTGFSFVVPAGAAATGTVTVAASCGTASSPFALPPAVQLTAISPAAELPGQEVVLTGTGFAAGSTVSFGGVAASSVTYTSPTSLTVVVPVGAAAGSSAVVVGTGSGNSSTSSPAFEVLQVYRSTAASGCLATASVSITGAGGAGAWRCLRLPGAGGAVVAAIEDTYNLGTVAVGVSALGTATSSAVRRDAGNRAYLDRNFYLTATNKVFPGSSVRMRFFGLSSELARLTAADAAATAATLKASQYSGTNEDCDLTNNDPAGERRLLAAPATVLPGADWFTAEARVADHFSEFYLTGAGSPLPVQLTAFTATLAPSQTTVQLAWATASEQNSAAFEVERSLSGTSFERIGTVAAAGSSSTSRSYALLDARLPADATTLYYRLRQVDQDGTASYSPVRTVALTGAAAGLALFPNPTHGGSATLTGAQPGTVVTAFDALGREVTRATADASGTAALAMPAGQPVGVYVVRVGSTALRLMVE